MTSKVYIVQHAYDDHKIGDILEDRPEQSRIDMNYVTVSIVSVAKLEKSPHRHVEHVKERTHGHEPEE